VEAATGGALPAAAAAGGDGEGSGGGGGGGGGEGGDADGDGAAWGAPDGPLSQPGHAAAAALRAAGRGLLSSTSELNLSRLCYKHPKQPLIPPNPP
jgi:hypothetical protein